MRPASRQWIREPGGVSATIGSALAEAAAALATAGFDESRRRARQFLAAALAVSAGDVLAYPERPLTPDAQHQIAAMLARLVAREPLSRILGRRQFWGLQIALSPDTLDPRPDSETVVEAVLQRIPDRAAALRLLDLGTGTGCLLLALLSELPNATGIGVDIAVGAVRTARGNAGRLGLTGRSRFAVGDWGSGLAGGFDVVVANPPYIASAALAALPPEVADHDPRRALDGGADGVQCYRAIAGDLPRLMRPAGLFAAEIGQGQAACVGEILARSGFVKLASVKDLAGIERVIVAGWSANAPEIAGASVRSRAKNGWNEPGSRLP